MIDYYRFGVLNIIFEREEFIMKFRKNLIVGLSILTLAPIMTATFVSSKVLADEVDTEQQANLSDSDEVKLSDTFTEEDEAYLTKLETIYNKFSIDGTGYLELSLSNQELKEKYDFTDQEVEKINDSIDFQHQQKNKYQKFENDEIPTITPYLHVSDWKVYFTYDDLVMYLSSAIQAGAPAVIATLASMGTITASPGVGTVLGTIAGLYSAGTVIYEVTQALANKQGWYIGVDWNGAFPNPTTGFW